jgi:hypothetical protein
MPIAKKILLQIAGRGIGRLTNIQTTISEGGSSASCWRWAVSLTRSAENPASNRSASRTLAPAK